MWLPATKTEVGSRGITVAGRDPDLFRLLHFELVSAVSGIYLAWHDRTVLAVTSAVALACYVPFVFYWNPTPQPLFFFASSAISLIANLLG